MSESVVWLSDEELAAATEPEEAEYSEYITNEWYLGRPDQFVADRFDEYFWSKQADISYSLIHNTHTAVPSCHDSGKSFTVSRLAAWWLNCHVPGEAFVMSTAPTFQQVRGILWREIGRAHRKGDLIGTVNQTEWHIPGVGLVGMGRKPADSDPSAFSGFHDKYLLMILDEACGIPKELWDAAETVVTNEFSRTVAIGNPDDPTSYFAEVCKPGSGWNVIGISAFDTPNFTGEWVPDGVRPLLLHPSWVERAKNRWGENSPIYISKVKGEFPDTATDGVVPWKSMVDAQWVEPDENGPIELGLDVGASLEGDATVIRERRGNKPGRRWVLHTDESEEIVGAAIAAIHETGATSIKVDVIGVGFGVAGHLRAERKNGTHDCRVVSVNVSESASDKKRFKNLRSELWWMVGREAIQDGLYALGALDDDTKADLLAPKYTVNPQGRIVVEPKDETRGRLGHSPDDADAFLLAFYKKPGTGVGKTTGKQARDYRLTV